MNNWINWYKIHAEDKNSKVFSGVSPLTFTGDGNPLQTISITAGEGGIGIPTHNLFDPAKIEFLDEPSVGASKSYNYFVYNDFISAQDINNWTGDYKISLTGVFNKPKNGSYPLVDIIVKAYDSNFVENELTFGLMIEQPGIYPSTPKTNYEVQQKISFTGFPNSENIAYYKIYIGYNKDVKVDTLKVQLLKTEKNDSTTYDYEPYGYKALLLHSSGSKLIFMDSPIAEGETKVFSNLEIPTVKGENTFIMSGNAGPATISVQTQGMSEGFENYFRTQLCLRH
jgi:hypothetical protein